MRAFRLSDFGHVPTLAEVPLPDPRAGEIRLRITACALNFADLLMIDGRYQERPPLPLTLGMEVAGVVDALGPGVAGPAPGTRVAAFGSSGGLADYGCWPAERCLPLSEAIGFRDAAAFQIAYGTGHLALDHRARLQPGETLFVTGAAGGVGLAAVEIGRRMGARVIASARGADRLAIARAAGAHETIDSDTPDLRAALKDLGGVDVTYDTVGGPGFHAALRASRPEGRLLAIGFAGGDVPQIRANLLLVKNLSVIGLYFGGYLTFAPDVLTRSLATLLDWLADGSLKPHVSHELPLDRAAEGLDLLRSRQATGKVVITPGA
ncbi:NADPH:quinone oxidoreductase family protein [Cereibacter sphaeroides]|uniref:NADPH:quinone oxidoreductase family protein n=1 Tax=Cereibacter sphaeroides TaxID=1063 RepID=UPI001F218D70|nr:NADPH:quinone oxidoreductase family protein [Cereibacter sphaeroides]MCE6961228.1 NADPH:quinone oxidoreductase family protein [Cereibacter sphaeroides]MCE6970214.1 NADPH:quinone oxidoreductase family protein [Cereibacter sphaeroides]MCE6974047.1 NADPH:quinone oxidoreductase family protein [Cereibacter sphaeroides]